MVGLSFCGLFLPQGNSPPTTTLTWDSGPGVVQITESLADLEKALLWCLKLYVHLHLHQLTCTGLRYASVDHKSADNGVAMSRIPEINARVGYHCGSASWNWSGLLAL